MDEAREIIAEEPVKLYPRPRGSAFLMKRGHGLALEEDITGGDVAASDLEGMISKEHFVGTLRSEARRHAIRNRPICHPHTRSPRNHPCRVTTH